MEPKEILARMGIPTDTADTKLTQFRSAEDGTPYEAWLVSTPINGKNCVLKKAKNREAAVYTSFLSDAGDGVPRLYRHLNTLDGDYLLMEYIRGDDLCHCTREMLTAALDALISLQNRYWNTDAPTGVGLTFEESLCARRRRGEYLCDTELERVYGDFLHLYERLPRTLCHDDLLPFNVLYDGTRAVLIDWELAGLLPYPVPFARLIAHAEESADAFFCMKDAEKEFAVSYYYEHLVRAHGISYEDYRRTLNYFLFYEYCEWIMLGNRYADADMERFRLYSEKARALIARKFL